MLQPMASVYYATFYLLLHHHRNTIVMMLNNRNFNKAPLTIYLDLSWKLFPHSEVRSPPLKNITV